MPSSSAWTFLLNLPILRFFTGMGTPPPAISPTRLFHGEVETLPNKTFVRSWVLVVENLLKTSQITPRELHEMHIISIHCMKQHWGAQYEYLIFEVWVGPRLGHSLWIRVERFVGDDIAQPTVLPFDSLKAAVIRNAPGETPASPSQFPTSGHAPTGSGPVETQSLSDSPAGLNPDTHISSGMHPGLLAQTHASLPADLEIQFGTTSDSTILPVALGPVTPGPVTPTFGQDGGPPNASPASRPPQRQGPDQPSITATVSATIPKKYCPLAKDVYSLTSAPNHRDHSRTTQVYSIVFDPARSPTLTDLFSILVAVGRMRDHYRLVSSNCYFFCITIMKYLMKHWPTSQAQHSTAHANWLENWRGRVADIEVWRQKCDEGLEASRASSRLSTLFPPSSINMGHYGFINFAGKITINLDRVEVEVRDVKDSMISVFEKANERARNAAMYLEAERRVDNLHRRILELEKELEQRKAAVKQSGQEGAGHSGAAGL